MMAQDPEGWVPGRAVVSVSARRVQAPRRRDTRREWFTVSAAGESPGVEDADVRSEAAVAEGGERGLPMRLPITAAQRPMPRPHRLKRELSSSRSSLTLSSNSLP